MKIITFWVFLLQIKKLSADFCLHNFKSTKTNYSNVDPKFFNAVINNQERCIAIHLFSVLLLVIINYNILFSDDNAKGKELPGTSGRGTPVQDKIVGELAKLNKQLADVFTQAMRSLFGH